MTLGILSLIGLIFGQIAISTNTISLNFRSYYQMTCSAEMIIGLPELPGLMVVSVMKNTSRRFLNSRFIQINRRADTFLITRAPLLNFFDATLKNHYITLRQGSNDIHANNDIHWQSSCFVITIYK